MKIWKMMLILFFAVLFLFSGCTAQPEAETYSREGFFNNHNSDYVKDGDLLYFVETNADQDGFLHSRLMVLDLVSGDCMPLCAKPECTHDNESCNARVSSGGDIHLSFNEGKLYWFDGMTHSTLTSVALDGTERKEIVSIDPAFIEGTWCLGTAEIAGDCLYVCSGGQSVQDGAPVDSVTVFRQKLGETQAELIYRSTEHTDAFGRVSGDKYVFAVLEDDAENMYEHGNIRMFSYDMGSGALEELYREEGPDLIYSYILASEDAVYLGGYSKGVVYSFRDGTTETYDGMDGMYRTMDFGDGWHFYWKNAHEYACRNAEDELLFEGSFPPDNIEFSGGIPGRRYIGYSDGKMFYAIEDLGIDGIAEGEFRRYIVEFDLNTQAVRAIYQKSSLP